MAAELITLPFRPVINTRGVLEPGALLDVFQSGTTTRVSVFADADLSAPLTNPVVADAAGVFPTVYFDNSAAVRVRVRQANGSVLGDADPYYSDGLSSTDLSFLQSGTGAVTRTVQSKLRDIVSRSDFGTLANAWAAAGFKPLLDPTSGAVFFTADSAPLDYTTSRARFVFQRRDTGNGATNELIPSAVFQFNYTGNGTVNSGNELSQTIWQGLFGFARKTGDGSGHNFTAIGELGATGPGGYNELGMFQGEATNTGSALGTISGVEMLIKDSPDSGTTTFSTKMQAVVGRIAKYNPTVRKSHNFFASSEGSRPPDAVLGVNPSGLASWQRGFDFQGATFTTGQFGLAPNNTFLAWLRAGGSASPVIGVNNADAVFLAATHSTGVVNITDSAFATRLQVDNNATDAVLIWVGGVLKRVTAGASDSGGTGFRMLRVAN